MVSSRHIRNRVLRRVATAVLVVLRLQACVSISFVPQVATTEWMELSALRRPSYPYIHANLPLKSLITPLALDGVCGFLPPTRDTGCFPAILNWMYSQWQFDRNDLFLRLHATNELFTARSVFNAPFSRELLTSALPNELLAAQAFVSGNDGVKTPCCASTDVDAKTWPL